MRAEDIHEKFDYAMIRAFTGLSPAQFDKEYKKEYRKVLKKKLAARRRIHGETFPKFKMIDGKMYELHGVFDILANTRSIAGDLRKHYGYHVREYSKIADGQHYYMLYVR